MPYFSAVPDQNSIPSIIESERAALGMERWLDALNTCDDKNLVKQA